MSNQWLAVVTDTTLVTGETLSAWWCVPVEAAAGDIVYMYCPASASRKHHGIFARATILTAPNASNPLNFYCYAHSNHINGRLLHVPVGIDQRFTNKLTAKDLKFDPFLAASTFVRRNFQGTSFKLRPGETARLTKLLAEREQVPSPHQSQQV